MRSSPVPSDLTARSLFLRVDTVDTDSRSVEARISTADPTAVFDLRRFETIDEILVASGARFAGDQVPLLDVHARFSITDILGSVRKFRRSGDEWFARIYVADLGPDTKSESAWQLIRQGHLDAVSVGYVPKNFADIPAGQKQRVGGQEYTAGEMPLRVTTQWLVREVSLVPVGADPRAKIRDEAPGDELFSFAPNECLPPLPELRS